MLRNWYLNNLAGAGAAYAGITPVFSASVTTGVAPLAVFFDSTDTTSTQTSAAWRDCLFGVDSGDTASGNFTYGTRAGQSKRKGLGGPTWGHVYETPGTNNSTNTNAKTLNPLFVTPLTGIAGFALDTSSPYATSALLDKNFSDALDKIRVSNGGAHMLSSNATSAWALFGQ